MDTHTPERVRATFTDVASAERAGRTVERRCPSARAELGDLDDALDAVVDNQRAEMNDSILAPAAGLWSGPMARGALKWGVVGLVAGVALGGLLLLLFDWPVGEETVFVVSILAAGALAVSSATFILGAGHRAEQELETTPEDPRAVLLVSVALHEADAVTAALSETGARSIRPDRPVTRRSREVLESPRTMPDGQEPS